MYDENVSVFAYMKKIFLRSWVGFVFLVLCLIGFGSFASALNRSSSLACNPDDVNYFPYGFICGSAANNSLPAPLSVSDGSTINTGSSTVTIPTGTALSVGGGYIRGNGDGIPKYDNPPGHTSSEVLVWITVDGSQQLIDDLSLTVTGNPGGTSGVASQRCPGSGAPDFGPVFNFRDLVNGVSGNNGPAASPVAYNPLTTFGEEDCQTSGRMVYWKKAVESTAYSFNLQINSGRTGDFCIRENVSVRFPTDGSFFPNNQGSPQQYPALGGAPVGSNYPGSDQNVVAAHVAVQSKKVCYHVDPLPPPPPVSGTCSRVDITDDIRHLGYITATYILVNDGLANLVDTNFKGGVRYQQSYSPSNTYVDFTLNRHYHVPFRARNPGESLTAYNAAKRAYDNNQTAWPTYVKAGDPPNGRIQCFSASCSLTVTGYGPGNAIIAGGLMHVQAVFRNTGPQPLLNPYNGHLLGLEVNGGASPDQPISSSGYPGLWPPGPGSPQTVTLGFDLPAATSLTATPRYLNHFRLGLDCADSGSPISLSYTFHLVPHAIVCTAGCDEENPVGINYRTYVDNTTSYTVNGVPQGSNAVFTAYGAGPSPPDGNNPAAQNFAPRSPPGNNTLNPTPFIVRPFAAGDQYCATVTLTSYSDGLVDSAGNVIAGTTSTPPGPGILIDGSGHSYAKQCLTVRNKPYFRVKTSGVSAGGKFAAGCLNLAGKGTLAGWNNNTGINPNTGASIAPNTFGSGTDYSSLALGIITGFGSAMNKTIWPPSAAVPVPFYGTALSFANTGGVTTSSSNDSPKLGGLYGSSHCINKLQQPPNNPAPMSGSKLRPLNAASFGSGQYTHTSSPGVLEIDQGNMGPKNIDLFVDGSVYISNNISYIGGGSPGTASSFVLHVTNGNIYIDPSVTQLDGYYVAEGDGTTTGKIYTCATAVGPLAKDTLYGCNKQLIINGAFAANQINLMRTYGSLRNAPNVGLGCANPGSGAPMLSSCGAEVFQFTPELYLSKPASGVSSDWGKYDSITSLPPVL